MAKKNARHSFRFALFFTDGSIVEDRRDDVDGSSAASMLLSEEAWRRRTTYVALSEQLMPGGVLASVPDLDRSIEMGLPLPRRGKKAMELLASVLNLSPVDPNPAPLLMPAPPLSFPVAARETGQLCLAF